jgi:hypothetical protein
MATLRKQLFWPSLFSRPLPTSPGPGGGDGLEGEPCLVRPAAEPIHQICAISMRQLQRTLVPIGKYAAQHLRALDDFVDEMSSRFKLVFGER